jgi:hypothetical protein
MRPAAVHCVLPAGEVAADGGAVQQVLETIASGAGGQSTANGQAQGRKA